MSSSPEHTGITEVFAVVGTMAEALPVAGAEDTATEEAVLLIREWSTTT